MAEPRTQQRFVHLRVHTAYSLLEGALKVDKLAKLVKADGMLAVAVTDTNNLFGALEFSEKMAGSGIQPIIGMTLEVDFGAHVGEASGEIRRIALIAKSEAGYANLMALSSAAYLDAPATGEPHVALAKLAECADDVICLTGGPDGPIDRALAGGQAPEAEAVTRELKAMFGDRLYVELQRHGLEAEQSIELDLVKLAYAHELPLVATNECFFAAPEDFEAHDALLCVAEGSYVSVDDRRRLSRNHGFKTQAEMVKLFSDIPEALENTLEITRRCAFRPLTRKPILPQFVMTPNAAEAEAEELARQARAGLAKRLASGELAPGFTKEDYEKRLEFELFVITRMKFPGYFLIVADFIQWAKAQGIPVGPGRGSGAGSVVAWSLTITDLDPMRFGLLFERFLNPERVSMPDFDIDFCQERRDEVITYVQRKYGSDRVAQIITFGRLQARAVLRDVGRVLSMPYGQVDKLCKLVPNNPAKPVTLAEAVSSEPKLQEARDSEPAVAQLIDIAQRLEGLNRNASTHAAGVVIGDRPLAQLVPLYRDPRSSLPATQFNMKWVEQAGLVKFDFLGLKTLSVLRKAEELVRAGGRQIDIAALPLDDKKSYELLSRGDTVGVFQLESTGMRDSLRRLKPDRFEDIIAMVALYRPGPMDNIPAYIARKHGEEKVVELHPLLNPILSETHGVIIYQEQVMQIAQVLSGYSLGEADLLRRAMGKKIKEEMAQQRTRFVEGAVHKGVDKDKAGFIFDLVDKFAGYGFNKSHAAAYALVAYQTAYLKANFPVEFMAASMTFELSNTDKLSLFCEESRRLGIAILPPSVNKSGGGFMPEGGAIRYALAALKNVGEGAVKTLVAERDKNGQFKSLAAFAQRMDARSLNKRMLETFAAAGAFDEFEPNRAMLVASADTIMGLSQRSAADAQAGQTSLFGAGPSEAPTLQLRVAKTWPAMEQLAREQEAIGFYLTGHPLDEYRGILEQMRAETWTAFSERVGTGLATGLVAGVVVGKREMTSAKGNRFAFGTFTDQTGQFDAVMFSDVLSDAADILEPGKAVLIHIEANRKGEEVKAKALLIQSLDKAAGAVQRKFRIHLDRKALDRDPSSLAKIKALLPSGGRGEVTLVLPVPGAGVSEVRVKGQFALSPALAGHLEALFCVARVEAEMDEDRAAA